MIKSMKKISLFCVYLSIVLGIVVHGACERQKSPSHQGLPRSASSEIFKKNLLENEMVLATIAGGEEIVVSGSHGAPRGVSGILFSEEGRGVCYTIKKKDLFCVVHNGRGGKWYSHIEGLQISPDGSRVAYSVLKGDKRCMVVDGREGDEFDTVGLPRFSPDSRHIVYNATKGGQAHIVLDGRVSEPFPSSWDELFNGDSQFVISIQNSAVHPTMHRVVVYNLNLKREMEKEVDAISFVYNDARNRIAATELGNARQRLIEFNLADKRIARGKSYKEIHGHTFGPDGISVAYAADTDGRLIVVLNGEEELLPIGVRADRPVVRPDGKALGIILADDRGFYFHQAFIKNSGEPKHYEEAADPVYSSDGRQYAFVAKHGKRIFAVVNGNEGPSFDMVLQPEFSPDGRTLIYRARMKGKRFVVLSDDQGRVIQKHPAYDEVYSPVFTRDGKSVAYGVKDGRKLIWRVMKIGK